MGVSEVSAESETLQASAIRIRVQPIWLYGFVTELGLTHSSRITRPLGCFDQICPLKVKSLQMVGEMKPDQNYMGEGRVIILP